MARKQSDWWQRGLVFGFATAVVMWVVAFVGHWPTLHVPVAVLGPLLLLCQVIGSARAGSAVAGAMASAVTGTLNLLVLGSVLTEAETAPTGEVLAQEAVPGAAIYVTGYLLASVAMGALAGWLGKRAFKNPDEPPRDWLAAFAIVTAVGMVPLLVMGGLVTSTNSGMAVPGWPDSFGANMFLYPLKEMTAQSDRFLEHSHRLMGTLVGLTTLVMMVWTLLSDRRGWVKGLAATVFLLVCIQGYIGGERVNNQSAALAMVHGVGSQVTFAAAVALAATMLGVFRSAVATMPPRLGTKVAWAVVITLMLQAMFGSMYRHMDHKHALYGHVAFSLVPAALAVIAGSRAGTWKTGGPAEQFLARAGKGLIHVTMLQMFLGLVAFWVAEMLGQKREPGDPLRVLSGTGHQLNGALLVATATLLAVMVGRVVWVWRRSGGIEGGRSTVQAG